MSRYTERYAQRNGPGDQRPTAMDIIQDENLVGELSDKVMIVTGVSSGIGIETIRALHATGATVYGTVRNVQKGQKVVDEILAADPSNTAKLELIEVDLESFDSIRKGVTEFLGKERRLNVLINNAGVMALPEGRTKDGWETQFATNHLGHFLMFQLLKDTLLASATAEEPSRVVSLASIGHRATKINFDNVNLEGVYDPWMAYGHAKTANIHFANELDRRYSSRNLRAVSVHPGGVVSGLISHLGDTMAEMAKDPQVIAYYKSPEQGAATSVYAAISEEWKSKGGKYLTDCAEAPAFKGGHWMTMGDDGYETWAYDPAAEEQLWNFSLNAVGIAADY